LLENASGESSEQGGAADQQGDMAEATRMAAETVPLIFVVAEENKKQWEQKKMLSLIRNRFFLDYGVRLPQAVVRYSANGITNKVAVFINEVKAADMNVLFDAQRIVNYQEELSELDLDLITVEESTYTNRISIWVPEAQAAQLQAMGYALRKDTDEFYQSVAMLLSRHVHEFFGVQETKNLLDELEPKYPELVKETYRHASVQKMSEVLQRLLGERISVRNIKLILDAMTKWAPKEKDVITLVEHIRTALGRYISDKFSSDGRLRAIIVSQDIEDKIRSGIKQTAMGTFLNLDPHELNEVMDIFSVGLDNLNILHKDLVILTSIDVRRFIKKLLESKYYDLEVLSFGEITDAVQIDVLKTI
jgi:type III secretion protein V